MGSSMAMYSMTERDLESTAQDIKSVILNAMKVSKLITEEEEMDWSENYAIMVRKTSFWKKYIKKVKDEDDRTEWNVVKKVG